MLREFVQNRHTAYHQRFDTWEEAIQAGCEPLLKDGSITQAYVESVINCVKEFGPYIVIAPMIAMPHASTGAVGVNKTHIAFMKVEELEEVAMMSWHAKVENPLLEPMQQELLDKHFLRKHGKNAYYGQR